MEVCYKNYASRNYMVIKRKEILNSRNGIQEKMVMRNNIPGLLKMNIQIIDGETSMLYDIQSRQNLMNMYEGREIGIIELKAFLNGIVRLFAELDNYLLSFCSVVFDPECIWLDPDSCDPGFAFYSCSERSNETVFQEFMKLAQFIIDHADKEDRACAAMAYDYYTQVEKRIFSPAVLISKEEGSEEQNVKDDQNDMAVEKTVYEEPEIPEEYWEESESEKRDRDNADNEGTDAKRLKIACICLIFIILCTGIFLITIMRPGFLPGVRMSDTGYLAAGSIIALMFAVVLVITVNLYNKIKTHRQAEESNADTDRIKETESVNKYSADEEEIKHVRIQARQETDQKTTVLGIKPYIPVDATLTGSIDGQKLQFRINRDPFVIGKKKEKVDGMISDSSISRIHASIREEDGNFYISDMNSTNGTYINGQRLQLNERITLNDGDTVGFANIMMTFRKRKQYQACEEF